MLLNFHHEIIMIQTLNLNKTILVLIFSLFLTTSGTISQERIIPLKNGKKALLRTDNTWSVIPEADTVLLKSGEMLILYPDSTWGYFTPTDSTATIVSKPASSDFLLESKKGPYGLWINLDKWDVNDGQSPNPEVDLKFLNKAKSAFGLTIFNKNRISLDSLKNQALENYKMAAPDTKFTKEEEIWVNGIKMLAVEMEATLKSGPMVYVNYYVSGYFGTIQASVFTRKNDIKKLRDDIKELMSGLVIYSVFKN